ncbi:NAD(P)-binding protein [Calocera cornea HHB12733]|uniref:NAD(P)-binding protein n=1 Tax=Calocera cornea HHB12733 TaxID=1353952 RepID=A0A165FML7_9BASI|nr:NAD(P)-binding protein [Calocera cornea HHB12733]
MSILPKIIIIGGTALSETGKYHVVVLTRNKSSDQAQTLAALPRVSLFEGTYTNEPDIWALFHGAYGAFVNTDGFVIGEKAELFWGMRIFEIAVAQGITHYVWGGVYYLTKLGGYDLKYRSGHMDGKGRVSEWLLAQKLKEVTVTVFTTCGYANMFWDGQRAPVKNDDGSFTFYSSIGDGVLPVIALEDIGPYITWIFDHRERADNMDLIAVTDILTYPAVVSAFERVTGTKATWKDLPYEEFATLTRMTDNIPAAFAAGPGEYHDPTGLSLKENFRGWWQGWRDSLATWDMVDVKLLDEIHPERMRSLEEWMHKVGFNGERKPFLKDYAVMASRLKDAEVLRRHLAGQQ